MKRLLLLVALFATVCATAQELTPTDKTPIYRRSFTAVYELTGAEPVREASLSPDKKTVAFVRNNDLFVRDISSGSEMQITHDGERNRIINGATDWVYEEEYLFTRAYEFSPDSRRIAYLRFDESRVPEFTMMRYRERLYPEPYTFKYPKAGEENSIIDAIADLVDQFRKVHTEEGVENLSEVPEEESTPPASDEENFVAAVRDALGKFGASSQKVEAAGLPALDADGDLTGYPVEKLNGWLQKIRGELENRSARDPNDKDLVGDESVTRLEGERESTKDSAPGNKEVGTYPKKGMDSMPAKMAVDAAIRNMKAAVDAKNAAIALVEPLVGSVTKLMALDSAEEVLRHTLELHGEKPPANIGLAGLHGMVGMLSTREKRAMATDSRPKSFSGGDGAVMDAVDKFRARATILG